MSDTLQMRWLEAAGFTRTTSVTAPCVAARLLPWRPVTVPMLHHTVPEEPTAGALAGAGLAVMYWRLAFSTSRMDTAAAFTEP
jgi:hypothetical protein